MRRAAAVLLAVLMLAACAPKVLAPGPFAADPAPPVLAREVFLSPDGHALPVRHWAAAGEPEAVVLAVHGFNDYSNSFAATGSHLSILGIDVWAYDQRGFGNAPGRGLWPGIATLTADVAAVARALKSRYPDTPLYLLGESMGGAVLIAAATSADPPPYDGIILSAPAVWARETMPPLYRATLWLASRTVPWLTLSGRGLGIMPSDNIEMLRALSRDPAIIRETRVDTIEGLVDLMDLALEKVDEVPGPILYLYGEKDEIVPPEPTGTAVASLPDRGGRVRVVYYQDGWHMLLRDLQAETVYADIAAWMADPHLPLPSGEELPPGETVVARQD